jgi:CBS domain-containing protein
MQKVSELMTPNPATMPPTASVVEAARSMRDLNVGTVVVMEGQSLRGIVTDRDIVVRAVAQGDSIGEKSLDAVCSRNVMTVSPDDDAERAVRMMRDKAVRRVPVMSDGKVVGVLSLGDLAIERDPGSALGDISSAPPNN